MSLWLGILSSSGSSIPAIGDSAYGGYMAGIIDTTRSGSILSGDFYQTGARYLLIVAPQSSQSGNVPFSTGTAAPAQTKTRWNGLDATTAMNSSAFEAAKYCYDLSYPSDGHSRWYLPAMDELELIYRNLKPTTDSNATGNRFSSAFTWSSVAGRAQGENVSSDPTGLAYTSGSPAQTSVTAFRVNGSQTLAVNNFSRFWSSTSSLDTPSSDIMCQLFRSDGSPAQTGEQVPDFITNSNRVRPVRRVLL